MNRTLFLGGLAFIMVFIALNRVVGPILRRIGKLRLLKRNGQVVEGILIDYEINKDVSDVITRYPIVEYYVDGVCFKMTDYYSSNILPVGTKIDVLYNKDEPQIAVINIDKALSKNYVGLVFVSSVIIFVLFATLKATLVR